MALWRPIFGTQPRTTLREFTRLATWMATVFQVPTFTLATRPTPEGPMLAYISDAAAGSRFQGYDVTAAAWVPLG